VRIDAVVLLHLSRRQATGISLAIAAHGAGDLRSPGAEVVPRRVRTGFTKVTCGSCHASAIGRPTSPPGRPSPRPLGEPDGNRTGLGRLPRRSLTVEEIRLAGWSPKKLCPRLCPNGCLLSTNTVA
jgi:hypothetical protein